MTSKSFTVHIIAIAFGLPIGPVALLKLRRAFFLVSESYAGWPSPQGQVRGAVAGARTARALGPRVFTLGVADLAQDVVPFGRAGVLSADMSASRAQPASSPISGF